MPYAMNSELPPGVRNALPDAAQSIFRNAFNSQMKRGLSEERAFASAWGAVRNAGWHKNQDGEWVKKNQPGMGDVHSDKPMGEDKKRRRKKPKPDDEEMHKAQSVEVSVQITKLDEDQNLVFGWLSVVEENGATVVDLQDHVIDVADLEKAAYDFVHESRVAGLMHEEFAGDMVESMVFSKDKQEALGIDLGKIGWWVGFKVKPEVFAKVKSGDLAAFSIGGSAVLEDMQEAA